MTVHSEDGLDEISPAAPTRLFFIDEHGIETDTTFHPSDVGISGIKTEDLDGGSAEDNARAAIAILKGKGSRALKEACYLNAGAAAFVYGKSESVEEGYKMARKALESGDVTRLVQKLRRVQKEKSA